MSIRSELHEMILKRGGTPPKFGGIAAALDELNKLPSGVTSWNDLEDRPFGEEMAKVQKPINTSRYQPKVGETVCVVWDGVEYDLVVKSAGNNSYAVNYGASYASAIKYVGNTTLPAVDNHFMYGNENMSSLPHDDVPFCLAWYEDSQITYDTFACDEEKQLNPDTAGMMLYAYETTVTPINSKFIPKAAAVPDVSAAPTADEFNALLESLRAAGYLAT